MKSSIKYGATIRLKHETSEMHLNGTSFLSRDNDPSKHRLITCTASKSRTSEWIIKPPHGYPDDFLYGQPVKSNAAVRLQNVSLGYYLHSHADHPAPLTKDQQEITGYNESGFDDFNDNWFLRTSDGSVWTQDVSIKFVHTLTGKLLHSNHGKVDAILTHGEQEVSGCLEYDDHGNNWAVFYCANPLLPPILNETGPATRWISLLNITAAFASLTGVTFLVLGRSLSNTGFANVLSSGFAALACLTVVSILLQLAGTGYKWIETHTRSRGWQFTYLLSALTLFLGVTLYIWSRIVLFSQNVFPDWISTLLFSLFKARKY